MSILDSFIVFSTFYGVIPSFWDRVFSRKVIRRMPKSNQIALTFDDGPDDTYTYKLLETLHEHKVRATFFVLAEKAAQNPRIIHTSKEYGHEIGLHSFDHKCQWLLSPRATKRDFEKSLDILNDIGVEPAFFRPPWGLFNLFTRYYIKKFGLNAVYWSRHAYDWSKYNTSSFIKESLLNSVKGGDIILLHDSSKAEGAPQNTIDSIRDVIINLKNRGFEFVTLRESLENAYD